VDTGATYTRVPRPTLEELGHKPSFKRRLRLADGKVIERDGCEVIVEINGNRLTTIAIFGDPGSEALLGAVTLEQFSLAPDPVSKRLIPVEALLMRVFHLLSSVTKDLTVVHPDLLHGPGFRVTRS